jgi:hypothetical protein
LESLVGADGESETNGENGEAVHDEVVNGELDELDAETDADQDAKRERRRQRRRTRPHGRAR